MSKGIYHDIAAKAAGELGINWNNEKFTLDDLTKGMLVEYEHGTEYPQTNVTNDDPIVTAKIALAHLYEHRGTGPNTLENTQYDYYDGLEVMETAPIGWWRGVNAENYWLNKKIGWYVVLVIFLIAIYSSYVNYRVYGISKEITGWSAVAIATVYLLLTWK